MAEETAPENTPPTEPLITPDSAELTAPDANAAHAVVTDPTAVAPTGAATASTAPVAPESVVLVGPTVPSGSRVVIVVSNGPSPTVGSAYVEMPDIMGERQGDALSVLQDTGLSVQVFNDYSLTVERGGVMAQRPSLGTNVPAGSEVVLLVSSGGAASHTQSVALPRLAGLSEGEAVTKLQAAGLSPQVVRAYDANAPIGRVIAQLPDEVSLAAIPRRRRSTAWIWIVTAVVLIAAVAAAFFYYQNQPLVVPNVVGLSQTQAEDAIVTAGFKVGSIVPTQTISAAEIGNVVTQTPSPNREAKRGSDITVSVSGGQALVVVPDVAGKVQADAEKALKGAGFQVAQQQGYSPTVSKGSVVSQSPVAGQKVPVGTTVGITISRGAENVIVPGVIGQAQTAALTALKAAGLGGQAVLGYHDNVAKGQVFGQMPTAGTTLAPKTVVGLLVSNGPMSSGSSTSTVPATIGNTLTGAQTSLKAAGLTGVAIVWSGTGKANNVVVGQLPDAGAVIARNSSIILIVSNGK